MNVKIELYKVFHSVAKTLSFSEAANELFISQSAVSQNIKALEEKLNCQLFVRNRKQVRLTIEGEILFKYTEQALNAIKAGERSIRDIHSLEQGEVKIGASDTICKHYLLPYFKKFNTLFPNIKIRVTNRTSPICLDLLKNGNIDVGIVNLPDTLKDKTLQGQKLKPINDVFIAGQNFKHLKRRVIKLDELADYPLLMLEKNTTTRQFFDTLMMKRGLAVSPEVELGSVDLLIELAKIGLGISFVAKDYIQKELEAGEIFVLKITEKIPRRHLGIVINTSVPLPLAAQKFIEILK